MIRPATSADVPALAALEQQAFGTDAWSSTTLADEIDQPGRTVLVAERDGAVVGYLDVGVVADVADLHRVVVTLEHRRAGLAGALVDAGLAAAVEQGAVRMLLEVADDNEPALALYASRGFGRIARRRGYYAGGRDALVLEASC